MKRMVFFRVWSVSCSNLQSLASIHAQDNSKAAESDVSKLVYADFQNLTQRPARKQSGRQDAVESVFPKPG